MLSGLTIRIRFETISLIHASEISINISKLTNSRFEI